MSARYYKKCSDELKKAKTERELLDIWHSIDFDKLTQNERDELNSESNLYHDKIRGFSRDISTDFKLADFCHGGDLTED